jgi:phosphopantothenoylcysteine decarboxylase
MEPLLGSKVNLVLGLTGSVASIKLDLLIEELVSKLKTRYKRVNICVVATENARKFLPENVRNDLNKLMSTLAERLDFLKAKTDIEKDQNPKDVLFSFDDQDEWSSWQKRDDPVLHIELRKWAHLLLIAPLDANTLAKISNGLCDNLLTCLVRAWDMSKMKAKPIVICPAMNTCMYEHPLTNRQLSLLVDEFGFQIVQPIHKTLMCGDVGMGAMAHVQQIAEFVSQLNLSP